ncbi:hypothetical protein NLC29_01755 [Candidatus Aminicenantes bacterium AH-873-B07]|nr:hypothetical protein [Candidatus Aminicenantes bacterium AH-873-B07]
MIRKLFLFILILIFSSNIIKSQCIIGQYEDEAPFRTWNILGVYNAQATGLGESLFGLIEEPFGLTLFTNKFFSFSLSFSNNKAEFFRYSFVNTSNIYFSQNLKASYIGLDFAYGLIKFKNWIFAFSLTQPETYFRPGVEINYSYRGKIYRKIKANFEGYLNSFNFSIGRKINKLITIGMGIHYVYGEIKRETEDDYIYYQVITTDNRFQKLNGYYFTLTVLMDINPKLKIIIIIRTPYTRYSKSESLLKYYSQKKQIEIQIKGDAEDKIKIPFAIGGGVLYKINKDLFFTSNLIFFNWSNYKITYFDENRKRDFRNIVKFSAGMEYLWHLKIKKKYVFFIPLRLGYIYDPQPMKVPKSYYNYLTMGTGIHFKKYSVDFGFIFGKENGSGNFLRASRIVCNLNFHL